MILIIIMLLHQMLSIVYDTPANGRKNAIKHTNHLSIRDFNIQRMISFLFLITNSLSVFNIVGVCNIVM